MSISPRLKRNNCMFQIFGFFTIQIDEFFFFCDWCLIFLWECCPLIMQTDQNDILAVSAESYIISSTEPRKSKLRYYQRRRNQGHWGHVPPKIFQQTKNCPFLFQEVLLQGWCRQNVVWFRYYLVMFAPGFVLLWRKLAYMNHDLHYDVLRITFLTV